MRRSRRTAALPSGLAIAAFTTAAIAQPPGLELTYYRPPDVKQRVETDGSAVVVFTVLANGRVDDAVTLATSDRRLGEAAVDAVKQWRFARDPEQGRGREAFPSRVLHREVVEFVFKRDVLASLNHREGAKAWFPQDYGLAVRTVLADDLEKPLARVPRHTSDETTDQVYGLDLGGKATVSFVVDETGGVRVPFILAADDPALGASALAMIRDWRYEPPTHGGKPVLVEQRFTFTFRGRPP